MTFDFDSKQFRLFLRLLSTLGSRHELTSQFGLDQHAAMLSSGFGLLIGGFVGLAALAQPPARGYLVTTLAISALWLVPQLVSRAADTFMNPGEVAVLAHRPVRTGAYLAAKTVYLFKAALIATLPLNLVPALAGLALAGTRWFYPLTHLLAVVLGTIFTALVACGVLGALFRVFRLERVRAAALWVQLVAVTVVPLAPRLFTTLHVPLDLNARVWSAIPIAWFASIGLLGQTARPPLDLRLVIPVAVACMLLVGFGMHALTQDYLTRVSTMMRLRARRSRRGPVFVSRLVSRLTFPGGQPTRAGTMFVSALALRDWQFRRTFLSGSVGIVAIFALGIGRRFSISPFAAEARFSPLHFLPVVLGVTMLNACVAVAFTERPQAKWIFQTMSATGLRGVVRGTYWGLWRLFVALPHVVLVGAAAWFWGLPDAVMFCAYSLAVTSLYLGAGVWLADGLPFTKPADLNRRRSLTGVMFAFIGVGAALAALQHFVLFPRVWPVPVAAVVLAFGAWIAATVSFRILEDKSLVALATSEDTRQMFAQAIRE